MPQQIPIRKSSMYYAVNLPRSEPGRDWPQLTGYFNRETGQLVLGVTGRPLFSNP